SPAISVFHDADSTARTMPLTRTTTRYSFTPGRTSPASINAPPSRYFKHREPHTRNRAATIHHQQIRRHTINHRRPTPMPRRERDRPTSPRHLRTSHAPSRRTHAHLGRRRPRRHDSRMRGSDHSRMWTEPAASSNLAPSSITEHDPHPARVRRAALHITGESERLPRDDRHATRQRGPPL